MSWYWIVLIVLGSIVSGFGSLFLFLHYIPDRLIPRMHAALLLRGGDASPLPAGLWLDAEQDSRGLWRGTIRDSRHTYAHRTKTKTPSVFDDYEDACRAAVISYNADRAKKRELEAKRARVAAAYQSEEDS